MARVEFDVRDDLRNGREPFEKIMAKVATLEEGDEFVLYATFAPVPLYQVLGKEGWVPAAEQLGPDDWRIVFRR